MYVHFNIDSKEFSHFSHTIQLALGPPPLPPAYSQRPQYFNNVKNIRPLPFVVELPHHHVSINNVGWNLVAHPLVSGINGWGNPIRKDQPHQPTLSIASENVPPIHPNVVSTSEETSSSHEQSSHSLVPLHPVQEKQEEHSQQPEEQENAIQPVVDIQPTAENTVNITSVSESRPPIRHVSFYWLSFIPKIFQHFHDYGLF